MSDAVMAPLFMYRGEEVKALEYARKTLMILPGAVQTLAHLRNDDLQAGRYAEARARYERAYPASLQKNEPTIDDFNCEPAIDLVLVLSSDRRTGTSRHAPG